MFRAEQQETPPLTWTQERAPESFFSSAVLAATAALVTMWPYTSVIGPGAWSLGVVTVIVLVALTGYAVRSWLRRRPLWLRETATMLAQFGVATFTVIQLVARDTTIFILFPTPGTFAVFRRLGTSAWEEIVFGSAPLEATAAMTAMLGIGFAVVAVLLDQLVIHRGAVLAGLLAAMIGALPMIVAFSDVNVPWFLMLAALMLVLFGYTARRHPQSPRRTSTSLAAGVGVLAIAATLLVAPVLPVAALGGTGVGVSVDASLRLGDDLRRPNPVEVLTLATEEDTAPYLRLTTLSQFNGRVWLPDDDPLQPKGDGFGEPEWSEGVAVEEALTSIRVTRMSSSWLPVPYPATAVQGVGSTWRVMLSNRTLVSRTADAVGNDYTVTSAKVEPTLEQIRATEAAAPVIDPDEPPVDLPPVIAELANEVTASAATDYDRLIALQAWFRSGFSYSLETPVEDGFDGTGAEAVARFLEVRSGYCIHFAGAFALMAQSLDMQVRIVVGYLPGSATDETRGEDETVFSVNSDQLHSWPEVLFPGVGWVAFEPTATLGVPTAFRAGTTTGDGTSGPSAPAPTSAPDAEQTTGPEVDRDRGGDSTSGAQPLQRLDAVPVALTALGVLLVLLLPGIIRLLERAVRRDRSRRGAPHAAWAELRDSLIDLGLPMSDADSPRARGAMLVRERGVDAVAMSALTDAVERSSYARTPGDVTDLAAPLDEVLAQLRAGADRPTRVRAFLLPSSLFAARGASAALLN